MQRIVHAIERRMNSRETSEWAETLRAAAHPIRLQILAELLHGPKCVTTIRDLLNARQPNVSQHLSTLKHSGLVAFSQHGASRCYYLPQPGKIRAIFRALQGDYATVSLEEVSKKFRGVRDRKHAR